MNGKKIDTFCHVFTKARAVTVSLVCASITARALTTSCLWGWFIVPLGAPEIDVVHAFVIIALAHQVMGKTPRIDMEKEVINKMAITGMDKSIVLLLLGYLASMFV